MEMLPEELDPNAPLFTFKDTVELTQPGEKTLENYVQWQRVVPHRIGGRRMFTFEQLLQVDVMYTLATMFRVEPNTGALIANTLIEAYLPTMQSDVDDVRAGRPWHSPLTRDAWTYELTRDAETQELRATNRRDTDADSVMLVVPMRPLARRILGRMAGQDAKITFRRKAEREAR